MKTATAVVESADSCLSRTANKSYAGSDFFVPAAPTAANITPLSDIWAACEAKTPDALRAFHYILIDTCELMSAGLKPFLTRHAAAFRANNIKLSITPPVMMELFRHCSHTNESTQQEALRGWNLVVSPEFRDLFETYPPSNTSTHADPNILDAVRNLKFKLNKNVLILTGDKKLTSSIYNACCTKAISEIGGKVQVLHLDKETTLLTHYHPSRLENLDPDILLPVWHLIGKPTAQFKADRYFRDTIFNGTVFMDSSALKYALKQETATPFLKNVQKLQALRPGQTISVVSTSLCDAEIRAAVEADPHLFNIVEAAHPLIPEEEALYQALLDASNKSRDLHLLLISNHPGRYEAIARRLPTCHRSQAFWGCHIQDGYLRNSARHTESIALSA